MTVDAIIAFLPLFLALAIGIIVQFAVARRLGPRRSPRDHLLLTLWMIFMLAVGITVTMRQPLGTILAFSVAATLLALPWLLLTRLGRRLLNRPSIDRSDETGDERPS
jgi:hypothetical protein